MSRRARARLAGWGSVVGAKPEGHLGERDQLRRGRQQPRQAGDVPATHGHAELGEYGLHSVEAKGLEARRGWVLGCVRWGLHGALYHNPRGASRGARACLVQSEAVC